MPEPPRQNRALLTSAALAAVSLLLGATTAAAAGSITVSKRTALNPSGERITVSGSGFDQSKGIYVAVCVDNGPGRVPTPCLGGADTAGGGGGSAWISSNPPSYGKGLATPYGPGGSFRITLAVAAVDPVTGTDCRKVACAVVTRADHTRSSDRSQDTRVRISFAAPAAPRTTTPPPAPPATTRPPKPTTTPPTTTATPTTTAPTTTATTTTATTATAPATTGPEVAPAAATAAEPDRTGWWIGGAIAVLAAAAALVALRLRRASRPD